MDAATLQPTVNGIASVLGRILDATRKEDASLVEALRSERAVQEGLKAVAACDPVLFARVLVGPGERLVDGVLDEAAPGKLELQFLFRNCGFVERQIRGVIQRFEGTGCCADKTRWLMRQLAGHLMHGRRIQFDQSNQAAYWVPKRVLNSEEAVLGFFMGVRDLHNGHYDRFVMQLAMMHSGGSEGQQEAAGH